MQKATRQQTKEHNSNLVLKVIFERESISRAEIARVTSLTRTTVSEIVADLIAEGLVKEIGMGSSIGGKSPILLSVVPDSRYLIGLDLAYDHFTGAVVNLRGEIIHHVDEEIHGLQGDAALASVYAILERLIENTDKPLVGIGIGASGLVDARDGIVIEAVNLDWKDLPLAQLIQDRYNLPVLLFNDSQAAALCELTFGKGHPAESNLVVINLRHGIGAGIILNGSLFHGDGGGAGEIGHVVVVAQDGLPCPCGNHGCLETVAGVQAVLARTQALARDTKGSLFPKTGDEVTLDSIEQAFSRGDPLARRVVLEAGHYLGVAISSLIGTLNIHQIVLTGDLTRFGEPWLNEIRKTMSQMCLGRLVQDTHVEIGQLGTDGVLLGASAMILNNYALLFSGRHPMLSEKITGAKYGFTLPN